MSAKWKSSPLRSRVMKYLVRVRARARARLQVRARVRLQVRGRAGARDGSVRCDDQMSLSAGSSA